MRVTQELIDQQQARIDDLRDSVKLIEDANAEHPEFEYMDRLRLKVLKAKLAEAEILLELMKQAFEQAKGQRWKR